MLSKQGTVGVLYAFNEAYICTLPYIGVVAIESVLYLFLFLFIFLKTRR